MNAMPQLNTLIEGQGPMVVLSHALGCDLHMWDGLAELLKHDHTVLRYDHRNHGQSELVPGAFGIETLADEVAELIRQHCHDGEPVDFVGVSMGGMTAQALATRHPELLRSIVIANSSAHYPDAAPWQARERTVQAEGVAAIATGAIARWLTPEFAATPQGAVLAAALHRQLVATDAAGYIASCNAVAGIDFRQSNPRVTVPALVIAGTRDEATPPAMSEAIAAAIPGARLVTIDAAHLSVVEQPAAFAALLNDFWHTL